MQANIIKENFPLVDHFGRKYPLQAANFVKSNNLLPLGSYVKKDNTSAIIGRTTWEVDPLSDAYNMLFCDIVKEEDKLIDPSKNASGHFQLLDLIPLLDAEIEQLENELREAGYLD